MKYTRAFFLFLMVPFSAYTQESSWMNKLVPDFVQMQYAGNIGLASGGIGYTLHKDLIQISLLNGYTPAAIAGKSVNTIALRGTFDVVRVPINNVSIIGYVGLGCNFETSGRSFYTSLPERYPKKYHNLSAVHATAALGGRIHLPLGEREGQGLDLYGETGTLDTYMYYYFKNKNLSLTHLFSAALGLRYHFGR